MRWPIDIRLRENVGRLRQAVQAFLANCRRAGIRLWRFKNLFPGLRHPTDGTTSMEDRAPIHAGNLGTRLGAEKEFLLAFVREMETEFLATGTGLMHLAQRLNENQKECEALTNLTIGRSQDAAVQFAFQLLKKAEDLVLASYEQYDHVFATFRELQGRLMQLARQHDDLMRVLSPLSFITIAFRIEASRHPPEVQQAFFTLATNVNDTVSEVRSTMVRQFEDLVASERIARRVMEQISASIQKHRQEVTTTLQASHTQLRLLSEALARSGAGAEDLSQSHHAVSSHISAIVMAQQCQDITRQRIEHVGEALEEMRAHLAEPSHANAASETDARQFIFQAGQIQLKQVQSVFEQLNHAAVSLKSGIQSLRAEAGAAAETAVAVGATTLDAHVAGQCQSGIEEILSIIKESVRKISEIIAVFEPLQASFVDCTGKATALASDVRQAGLNAQIFAIHAPSGATLEVLAGRVRGISEEVIQQVGQMGHALHHTTELVNNLKQRLEDFKVLGQAEQDILDVESVLSQKKIQDLESSIPQMSERITRQQSHFTESVDEILAQVRFPAAVADATARSIGFFDDLVSWSSKGRSQATIGSTASRQIDRLQSKYSMESERLAHAAAFQPVRATAAAGIVSAATLELFDGSEAAHADPPEAVTALVEKEPVARAELGDNVELF